MPAAAQPYHAAKNRRWFHICRRPSAGCWLRRLVCEPRRHDLARSRNRAVRFDSWPDASWLGKTLGVFEPSARTGAVRFRGGVQAVPNLDEVIEAWPDVTNLTPRTRFVVQAAQPIALEDEDLVVFGIPPHQVHDVGKALGDNAKRSGRTLRPEPDGFRDSQHARSTLRPTTLPEPVPQSAFGPQLRVASTRDPWRVQQGLS